MRINTPNRLTILRLFVAFGLFAVLIAVYHEILTAKSIWFTLAAGLYIVGAITDVLDGYLARRWQQITGFGRVADPFVDKILVCGAFIMLIPLTRLIPPWFVVAVVIRELGITALRGQLEGKGKAFGAGPWGKAKMLAQSILVPTVLVYEAFRADLPTELAPAIAALMVVTLLLTVVSGLVYLRQAPMDFS